MLCIECINHWYIKLNFHHTALCFKFVSVLLNINLYNSMLYKNYWIYGNEKKKTNWIKPKDLKIWNRNLFEIYQNSAFFFYFILSTWCGGHPLPEFLIDIIFLR